MRQIPNCEEEPGKGMIDTHASSPDVDRRVIPDFYEIALRVLVDQLSFPLALKGDTAITQQAMVLLAEELRQVWNARGALDIATLERELSTMMGPSASGPYLRIWPRRCTRWIARSSPVRHSTAATANKETPCQVNVARSPAYWGYFQWPSLASIRRSGHTQASNRSVSLMPLCFWVPVLCFGGVSACLLDSRTPVARFSNLTTTRRPPPQAARSVLDGHVSAGHSQAFAIRLVFQHQFPVVPL